MWSKRKRERICISIFKYLKNLIVYLPRLLSFTVVGSSLKRLLCAFFRRDLTNDVLFQRNSHTINMKKSIESVYSSVLIIRIYLTLDIKTKKFLWCYFTWQNVSTVFGVWLDVSLIATVTLLGYPRSELEQDFSIREQWYEMYDPQCMILEYDPFGCRRLISKFYKVEDT